MIFHFPAPVFFLERRIRGGILGEAIKGTAGLRLWAYMSCWTSQQIYWLRFIPRAAAAWFMGSSSSKGAVKDRLTYFLGLDSGTMRKILLRNIDGEQMDLTPSRTTRTYCISVPAELRPQIERLAKQSGRSVSGYLSWLIREDTNKKT